MSNINSNSIRQICLRGFLAGTSRKEIGEQIKAAHPTSRAAALSTKHIAWHYGDMKKRGLLSAAVGAATPQAAEVAVAEAEEAAETVDAAAEIARQAAEMAARVDAALDAADAAGEGWASGLELTA